MSQMIFKIEILFGSELSEISTPSTTRNSTLIQLLRPTTMPLKQAWLIIRRPMVRLLMLLARSILSSIRVCFMRGLCCMTWLKLSSWRDQIRPSTRSEAIFLDISLWLIVKLPRPLWNLALMIPRKKSFCFVTSSSVTTACLSMEVQSVHALWKQRLSIWLTIWMQAWWWCPQLLLGG